MKLKDRIKTYSFWVSLSSAIFLLLKLLGQQFNFNVDEGLFSDIFTTLCGILVILGIIAPPASKAEMPCNINQPNYNNLKSESDDQPTDTQIEETIQDSEEKEQIETAEEFISEVQNQTTTQDESVPEIIDTHQEEVQSACEIVQTQPFETQENEANIQAEISEVQNIENSLNVLFDTNNLSFDEKLNLLNNLKSKIENNN